ncbi:MAG: hypothetical protein R3232_12365, partial [Clostridia bacterium]|nr:hypothetical protein [Clostridia bacterium]
MIYFTCYLILIVMGYIVFNRTSIREKIIGWKSEKVLRPGSRTVFVICGLSYVAGTWILFGVVGGIVPAMVLGIIPAVGAYAAVDLVERIREDRETRQITYFLMTMSKWSGVKNDLVYCLRKTDETQLKNPLGKLVKNTLGRIYGGMEPAIALTLLEQESYGPDMRYLVRNIRFSAEKGGDLSRLFRGMEEQFFKIDEEFFKRRISTLRDRFAVYGTLTMVMAAG